jgi:hypothetical protein
LQQYPGNHPDLPVREQAGDAERPSHPHIGGQAPQPQHISHQSRGNQECAECEREMTILPLLSLYPAATL